MSSLERLRRPPALRALVREINLSPSDFVAALYVAQAKPDFASVFPESPLFFRDPRALGSEARALYELGIRAVYLQNLSPEKDELASAAFRPDGPLQDAITAIREASPGSLILSPLDLSAYMVHGLPGRLERGRLMLEDSLELLAEWAVFLARLGVDVLVSPSLIDGHIGYLRESLDEEGLLDTTLLPLSVYFDSPYHRVLQRLQDSEPLLGPSSILPYRMDPANLGEASRSILLAEEEGADLIGISPGSLHLDVVKHVRENTSLPLAAFEALGSNLSMALAAKEGLIDLHAAIESQAISLKRAGADFIVSDFAKAWALARP